MPDAMIETEQLTKSYDLNQQEFRRLVVEAREGGATAFVSSHVLSEVEELCTRVGIIRDGRVVRVGAIHEVKAPDSRTCHQPQTSS